MSEATRTWERWRSGQRFRRRLGAWGTSLGLAGALVALAAWGFLPVFTVGEKGEALTVKLGNPEGEDLPLSVSSVPDQAMQAVLAAQRETALTTVEETRASVPDPEPDPAAVPVPKAEVKPAPKAVTKPEPAKPATKPATVNPPTDKPAVTEKVIRGNEKGNASELILKPQGDKISQNLISPPYMFMPLPLKIDPSLLARIKPVLTTDSDGNPKVLYTAEERREILLQFYTKGADGLTLGSEVPVGMDRSLVWQILDQAGYDLANADYKKGKNLKPVVLSFKLGVPKGNGDNPALTDVKLEQSSGSGPVDEAVLYAFQRSTFANGTGQVAQGRYTYDFNGKK